MMDIQIEIFIASRILEGQQGPFSKKDLVKFIKHKFGDERPGIGIQASSKCVANAPLNFSVGYNYLWRITNGIYRCYRPQEDAPYRGREKSSAFPDTNDLPHEYRYLISKKTNSIDEPETLTVNAKLDNVLELLEICGNKLGFEVRKEYEVPMGRIDLVWLLPTPLETLIENNGMIPIMGFELESSWRTRKHIKGDILNLQLLKASHGVIILQTGVDDNESEIANLIRNTKQLLPKMNANEIHVWADSEVVELCKILQIKFGSEE